eukprot:4039893-Pyramimonas_sp.AAC.1
MSMRAAMSDLPSATSVSGTFPPAACRAQSPSLQTPYLLTVPANSKSMVAYSASASANAVSNCLTHAD